MHRMIPPYASCAAYAAVALLLALTAPGASAQAARSATVTFASADAVVVSAQGERRPAKLGLTLTSGDTIETGKGRVQLRMVDGGMMALQPDTTLRLDDYHLASEGGTDEKGYMSLVKGGLRTVSGFIGKARPDNYRLQTPTGMIGIRGTEYTAVLKDGLTVGVIGGRVAVCNDGGCADVSRGMSAFVASRTERPVLSKLVSVVVPASTSAAAGAGAGEVADATTAATALPASTTRTSGEEVRSYLQALARPVADTATSDASAGSDSGTTATSVARPATPAPGSFSPPPAVLAAQPVTSPSPSAPTNTTPTAPTSPVSSAEPTQPGATPPAAPGPGPAGPLPSPTFVESSFLSSKGTVTAVSSDDKGQVGALQATGY
ncbi:MAG: hypothetical protein JWQ88_1032, partial [Rhodoferax sp.]|nr:hypothetical protein [Rhodoferax sp.]